MISFGKTIYEISNEMGKFGPVWEQFLKQLSKNSF